jgi:hypothetical protein
MPNRERKAVTVTLAEDFRVIDAKGSPQALVDPIAEDNLSLSGILADNIATSIGASS